ncbi:MAG: hypothetical protein UY70_C0001G0004 [Candidatus Kaiserbacteria bacterium GW2011_GWB1_52_6]|uniref:Serine protease n=3 Tax=Candidatus Kaiseribacteriota TaxID=1752734 RepID=A0A0G1XJ84_9BACT|nr:MAG: hypothetical protein UY67_C0007G0004 [Candidatus Kaiserbacteria bacterium GW2011_GWA2_52_12]KKW28168.1 MAG: hypothetical protein UY70_C0001G0004 [Candidatus Kaiserbacteria bacterium GW2011_GWB1_52_6]KKW31021.1 MAG: hypothetical protein UY74_C0025G0009 [Candidatus Kaiserbacteria bacterium GW2011_GWC2_52_8b]
MEMEKLNKSQIVLLTLLVSFVTSIATGVVTVSLMDQAPPAIAQTVNRIVERTVEKVVQSAQTAAVPAAVGQTVVIKESQLISQSVDSVNPSVARLYTSDPESQIFFGLGLVVDKTGVIVTDSNALGDYSDAVVRLQSGAQVRAFVIARDVGTGIAYLQATTTTLDGKAIAWESAVLSSSKITLGETVVALSGKTIQRIGSGIVTALMPREKAASIIDTSISQDSIMGGSPLVDTDGTVLGISTGVARASSVSGFIPIPPFEKPVEKSAQSQVPVN